MQIAEGIVMTKNDEPKQRDVMAQVRTHLSSGPGQSRYAFPWFRQGDIWVKGYIYRGNRIVTGPELVECFRDISDVGSFAARMTDANGYFAIIIDAPEAVFCGVDRVCSTPLMYRLSDSLDIGDNFKGFLTPCDQIDRTALEQYLASGYTYQDRTLIEGVQQLLAGTFLHIEKATGRSETRHYYSYIQNDRKPPVRQEALLNELHEVHLSVFERMVRSLDGRQAVVPLSGGYDSRLILEMLARFNHRNVVCATWGPRKYWQVQIARDVARSMGFDWVQIENTRSDWSNWYRAGSLEAELELCGALTTIPYVQDNVLISKLQETNQIRDDAIFITGNSGDFVEGEHIDQSDESVDLATQFGKMRRKHMRQNRLRSFCRLENVIRDESRAFERSHGTTAHFDEYWEWKERQSKFISKCVKPFERYGFEWRMPFWDLELLDFWASVPRTVKGERRLFFTYAEKYMNPHLTPANPKLSFIRRYRDVVMNGRYGCYLARRPLVVGLLVSDQTATGADLNQTMRGRPLLFTRFNGVLAQDAFGHISASLKVARK